MFYTFPYTKRQRGKLPLTINLVGYYHRQEPIVRNRGFELFQWIYCIDGDGELILNGKKSILKPGELALTYPYEPHSYRALTEDWHVHIIGFSGTCCEELLKTLQMRTSGIYHFHNPDIFPSYFGKIIEIKAIMDSQASADHEAQKNVSLSSYLIELSKICYDFLLDLSLSTRYISASAPISDNETIKSLISYMEENYRDAVTLDQLANHVHLSRSYITVIFKEEMHQTIGSFLTNLRISHARVLLLENPELKVAEIGRLCGFENPSYFGEAFKKVVGVSPIEYRIS